MDEIDFTSKVAVVTGASRGIGRVIALALAARGAAVVGTARNLDSSPGRGGTLGETIDAVEAAGARGVAIPADITSADGVQSLIDGALAALGRIDVLVNNAGVYPQGRIAEFSSEEWDAAIAINVTAPFLLCRAVIPGMEAQGGGRILNISSNAAVGYGRGRIAYSTTKAALNRFTMNLAEELRESGIAVNAYAPGQIRTDMNDYGERGAEASEIEESIVWALGQDAATFTGQVVRRRDFAVTWGPGA
jgi:NAD(P)-dependent dehydrogenase (short-subunit alcohol dehydrogenase family)